MANLEDRANASEQNYVHSEELEFKAAARRNRMLGIWAGELMGLTGDSLENYAKAVIRADFEQPGEEDVIRKVFGDLTASNLSTRESEVRTKAAEYLAQAREALKAEE